jgi:nucleoside-diphosphate kinase
MDVERYAFEVTWYDNIAEITRRYLLIYFVRHSSENEVEMIDIKTNKKFLKRCAYPSVKMSDLFIGSKITVFSRQLEVVAYADPFTTRALSAKQTTTLGIITSSGYKCMGKAISGAVSAGLKLKNIKMVSLNATEAADIAGSSTPEMASFLNDAVIALELIGEHACKRWNEITSRLPGDSNMFYGSSNDNEARNQVSMIFGPSPIGSPTVTYDNCTLCVIKPHAVADDKMGEILDTVLDAGFEISALQSFTLDRVMSEEFLEVYKGVLPEFRLYVDEMSSGMCIAMEIRAENAVEIFRQFAGPHEVEIAKHIRPRTLRARYGVDKVKNAVHCTDLAEDATLECEYFFDILQRS